MTNYYKREKKIIIIIFLFKIIILTLLPLTGDEAYFIKWGANLAQGYYDHPPMIGWIIYLMSFVSDSHIFFRIFPVVTTFIVAWVIYKIALLYNVRNSKAYYIALIFLASPVDLLLGLITNDIALLLFSSLGTLALLYALEKKEWFFNALFAGIFLGLAFLSKYFALLLIFSLLLFSLFIYKLRAIKIVLVVTIVVSLFIVQNLYFNYNSCWNNIIFNFFARTEDNTYSFKTIFGYFGLILYIVTPWGLYYLLKTTYSHTKLFKLLFYILNIVFLIFFIVSLKNKIGLHWFLLFTPYIFLLFSFVDERRLNKLFKYNAILTFVHIAILIVILAIPTSLLTDHKKYSDIIMYTKPQEVCKELDKFSDERIFTYSYSAASVLSHYCKKELSVLFNTSKYGRIDDKLLDIRTLANENITLFNKKPIKEKQLQEVCNSYKIEKIEIANANFYKAICYKFNFDSYKTNYLDSINKKFYNIPDWLPIGECYFKDRYYKRIDTE
ncbi:MAG: glycosyltransferase family 39 protein [Sulfurimonas sp.]|nr:glycosyltransferase family 39 protein [Sulfurimonas sp.]